MNLEAQVDIERHSTPDRRSHNVEDVLTVAEAAVIAQRSVRTIRRAYRAGKLCAYRDGNGRGVRIRYGDLRAWEMATAAKASPQFGMEQPIGEIRRWKPNARPSEPSVNLRLLEAARKRRKVPRRR